MRICVIGHSLTPVSGHARGIFEIAANLERKGTRVDLFTDTLDDCAKQLLKKLSSHYGIPLRLIESPALFDLQRLAENTRLDESLRSASLVHVFDVPALFFVRKALQRKKLNLKIVYSLATFPKFDFRSLFSGFFVWLRIFDAHDRNFLNGFLFPSFLLPWIYSRADHILTSCQALQAYLWRLGVSREKVSVIYPPVNPAVFQPVSSGKTSGKFQVFYYGWISDIRGVSEALDAFKKFSKTVPDARFIISNPDTKTSLETAVLRRKILAAGRYYPIQFLDYQLNIQQSLEAADLVLLPFRGRFGYLHPPMTLIETIFKERVFLTHPLDSIREIVSEEELLVPEGMPLDKKMRDVYDHYALYQERVKRCRQTLLKSIHLDKSVEAYEALYARLSNQEDRYRAKEVYSDVQVAQTYDELRFSSAGGRLFDRIEKNILLAHIPKNPSGKILEVGSGTGRFLIMLAQKGFKHLYAADISQPLLNILIQKAKALHCSIHAALADIYHLPYAPASFETVYALRVLNQLGSDPHRLEALRQMALLLKPGGTLIVDVINGRSLAWLKDPDQHTDLSRFQKNLDGFKDLRLTRVLHRMSFSQTLMEKMPAPAAWLVYGFDLLFSTLLPFWGTRVYFIFKKNT